MRQMSRMDRLALLNSEVYQELEVAEINKKAQTLADKIVQSPTSQQAIRDGIAKALQNKADDEPDFNDFKKEISKLNSADLVKFFNMFADGLEQRGIDFDSAREDVPVDEIEGPTDEELEGMKSGDNDVAPDDDSDEVVAYVKESLEKLAYNCAINGETEAAYIIERFIQKHAQLAKERPDTMFNEDLVEAVLSFGHKWDDENVLSDLLEEMWNRQDMAMAKAFLTNKQIPRKIKLDVLALIKDMRADKQ